MSWLSAKKPRSPSREMLDAARKSMESIRKSMESMESMKHEMLEDKLTFRSMDGTEWTHFGWTDEADSLTGPPGIKDWHTLSDENARLKAALVELIDNGQLPDPDVLDMLKD